MTSAQGARGCLVTRLAVHWRESRQLFEIVTGKMIMTLKFLAC
jgi:hypothetical protein